MMLCPSASLAVQADTTHALPEGTERCTCATCTESCKPGPNEPVQAHMEQTATQGCACPADPPSTVGNWALPSQHSVYTAQSAAELRHMSDLRHNLELV